MKTPSHLPLALALVFASAAPFYAQADVPTDGLVAYYPFSGNADDYSGYGNHGMAGGATLTSDRFGNSAGAYHFNGSGDYIMIAPSPSLNITGNLTIAAWVYLSAASVDINAVIFSNMLEVSPHNGYSFRLWEGNRLRFFCGDMSLFATHSLPTDVWTHVAVVLDGTTATTYISGLLDSAGTVAPATSSSVSPTIGASAGRAYGWNGGIDDVIVYNRPLSSTEISGLAQMIPEPSTFGILAFGVLGLARRHRRA